MASSTEQDAEDTTSVTEQTPLLLSSHDDEPVDQSQPHHECSASASLLQSLSRTNSHSNSGKPPPRRWPSLLALITLCIVAILIIVFAFLAPGVVEQYASQAVRFEPSSLSIVDFTPTGVRARVRGDFSVDARRVSAGAGVKTMGRLGTWVARQVETGETEVQVRLPQYDDAVAGTAKVPGVRVNLRDRSTTSVDFVGEAVPGEAEAWRRVAEDWVNGTLERLVVAGTVETPVKSGILNLGVQTVKKEMVLRDLRGKGLPQYEIDKMDFYDRGRNASSVGADVTLRLKNEYPVDFTVPSLAFQILLEGCEKKDPSILVADALTERLHVPPRQDLHVDVRGVVHHLPDLLTQSCSDSHKSPLDVFVGKYLDGKENTVFVRGSASASHETPEWLVQFMRDIIVPLPLPGRASGPGLVRNFSLEDTHFHLPNPFAAPNTPASHPQISGTVRALIALPEEIHFNLSARRVRADADVYYRGDKLGQLDLKRWQKANSSRIDAIQPDGAPGLIVQSIVDKAPLKITDEGVFGDFVRAMMLGERGVQMDVRAAVDVEMRTALGEFQVHGIPAEGSVPVQPILPFPDPDGGNDTAPIGLHPSLQDLRILHSTPASLTFAARLNVSNPTPYAVTVPLIDVAIAKNGSRLGHATARNVSVASNDSVVFDVHAVYGPRDAAGHAIGVEIVSRILSGFRESVSVHLHEGSFPANPGLGRAMRNLTLDVAVPRLLNGDDDDGDGDGDGGDGGDNAPPSFVRDATLHLLTSTATFVLISPLPHNEVIIERINATASYEGHDVGRILSDEPFAVPGGREGTLTPRLPVAWSADGVGFGAVRRALGGTLEVDARAEVGVRVGALRVGVWFRGRGIGAKVRL